MNYYKRPRKAQSENWKELLASSSEDDDWSPQSSKIPKLSLKNHFDTSLSFPGQENCGRALSPLIVTVVGESSSVDESHHHLLEDNSVADETLEKEIALWAARYNIRRQALIELLEILRKNGHHDRHQTRSHDHSDSCDQHIRRQHDRHYQQGSHNDHSDSCDQHVRRQHDRHYQQGSHNDHSDSCDQHVRRQHDRHRKKSHDQYDRDDRRGRHNQRGSRSRCDLLKQYDTLENQDLSNGNQENQKDSKENAECSLPMEQAKFQKLILHQLLDLKKTVSDTRSYHSDNFDKTPNTSLSIKQINSLKKAQALDDELVNESHFIEMCKQCVRIGGSNARDMISNLLCRLMTKNLMCQYSMLGQRGKLPFIKTKLYSVIQHSVQETFLDSCETEIHNWMALKLRNAPKMKGD